MMQNKLLPCPFCGGEVSTYTEQVDANTVSYGFVCNDCFCNTYFDFADEEKAIDMWNTRKPMERIVEQLEDKKKEYLEGFRIHKENELYGVACGFGDAIKIVKGGVEDAERFD